MITITIPKNLVRRGNLVVVPRREYEEFLKLQKRLLWEEKDTDEAIRIFKEEKNSGALKTATDFASVLKSARQRKHHR